MPAALEARAVEARLEYLIRTGEKPVNQTFDSGPTSVNRQWSGTFDARIVTIRNGRAATAPFGLDTTGFELVDHPTQVRDFFDPAQIKDIYYPEMGRLIAARAGAARVHVFDHTLRSSSDDRRLERQVGAPLQAVHNDYTDWSGPQRLRDLLPDEAEALLTRRFAIVQVWRAITQTIERDPLAVLDSRTLDARDFIPAERRFPNRVGEIYQYEFNPAHEWYYFPHMRRDEALVFKVYDSATDGRARWGAHTAFDDPTTRPDAPARESIEIRAFAFF